MISTLLKWKWIYLAVAFASILFGIIVAISLPKKYTAKVMLAPESNNGSNSLGNLSNIASSFGVNVNGNSLMPLRHSSIRTLSFQLIL